MLSRRQERKNAKQSAIRAFCAPPSQGHPKQMRSIQQQIDDLSPDVNSTFCLLWEEIAQDNVPVARAARQMRVPYEVAAVEIGAARQRLQFAGVRESRYPIGSFRTYGVDRVPRREWVPEIAESYGVPEPYRL